MTEREAALRDLEYAHGMQAALIMAAQGAWEEAGQLAERRVLEALRVLRKNSSITGLKP